jgi:hypothetical protein
MRPQDRPEAKAGVARSEPVTLAEQLRSWRASPVWFVSEHPGETKATGDLKTDGVHEAALGVLTST